MLKILLAEFLKMLQTKTYYKSEIRQLTTCLDREKTRQFASKTRPYRQTSRLGTHDDQTIKVSVSVPSTFHDQWLIGCRQDFHCKTFLINHWMKHITSCSHYVLQVWFIPHSDIQVLPAPSWSMAGLVLQHSDLSNGPFRTQPLQPQWRQIWCDWKST